MDAAANRIGIPEQAPGQGLAYNRDIFLASGAFLGGEFAPSHDRDSECLGRYSAHTTGFRVSALIAQSSITLKRSTLGRPIERVEAAEAHRAHPRRPCQLFDNVQKESARVLIAVPTQREIKLQ